MKNLKKKQALSREVYKYPYSADAKNDSRHYLSDTVCECATEIGEKINRTTKIVFFYGHTFLIIGNSILPAQAIGLSASTGQSIISNVNVYSSRKKTVVQAVKQVPFGSKFNDKEIGRLYDLTIKWKNGCLTDIELIDQINTLRGGGLIDVIAALGIITSIIVIITNGDFSIAFTPSPTRIAPPNIDFLCGDKKPGNTFGYGKGVGPRSNTITYADLIQNAGSDEDNKSAGSYEYAETMRQLDEGKSKKMIPIEIGDETYNIPNPHYYNTEELGETLADQMYDNIRQYDTDVAKIAQNSGLQESVIKDIKDHVFYREHYCDKYVDQGSEPEWQRFDPCLQQALSWRRWIEGTQNELDRKWLRHEQLESEYETRYGCGYDKAHEYAQSHADGDPWDYNY